MKENWVNYLKKYRCLLVVMLLMLGLLWLYLSESSDRLLHLIFYDVGEGDGILIKTPTGKLILIDGGPSEKIIYDMSKDVSIFDRKIDIGVITHPHADHISGFIETLRRFEFEYVFADNLEYQTPEVEALTEELERSKLEPQKLFAGQKISIGEVTLNIFWPSSDYQCSGNINDCSVVIRLDYGKVCAYLLGDAGEKIQDLFSVKQVRSCPIIKVAHQGASDGLSSNFLNKIKPQIAVISVGENQFGHPSEEILEKLKGENVKALRTDRLGTIEIITDGNNYQIKERN